MNRVPPNIRFSLIATWVVDMMLYALVVVSLYLPDTLYGDNLLPVSIHNISFEAFGYYFVDFILLVVALVFRLKAVDKAVTQGRMTFRRLLVFSLVPMLVSVPLWFFPYCRVFAMMLVAFSVMQMLIDSVVLLRNEFTQMTVLMFIILIFTATNIGFVHWNRINIVYYKAVLVQRHCRQAQQWLLPSANWSVAHYDNGRLVRSEGNFEYDDCLDDLCRVKSDGEKRVNSRGAEHFIFAQGRDVYVVSKAAWSDAVVLFINITMMFFIYLAFSTILCWGIFAMRRKVFRRQSFFSQLRMLLLVFLLTCFFIVFFIVICFVSVRYIRNSTDDLEDSMLLMVEKLKPYCSHPEDYPLGFRMISDMADFYNYEVYLYDDYGRLLYTTDSLHLEYSVAAWDDDMFEDMFEDDVTVQAKLELDYNNNMRMLAYGIVAPPEGDRLHAIIWSESDMARTQHEFSIFLVILLILYFVIFVFSVIFSNIVSWLLAMPLREIDRKMSAISLGSPNTNSKIDYPGTGNDELTRLINNYNSMVDKLEESAADLALVERENSWRDMSRQIAHEIKNPLTPMRLILQQMMMNELTDLEEFRSKIRTQASTLLEQVDSLYSTACSLSDFARRPVENPEPVNLIDKVHHVADLFRHNDMGVRFEVVSHLPEAYIFIDRSVALRIFINLVRNAIQAIPPDRQGIVRITVATAGDDRLKVSVSDNGIGISPDVIELIFNTNYTTKTKGMGLGLCVVKDAVEASGGSVSVVSTPDVGTTFTILWPRYVQNR